MDGKQVMQAERKWVCNAVLNGARIITACCVICILTFKVGDAIAQAYPGANVNSSHPLDYCYITGPVVSGSTTQLEISPVTSLYDALSQSCTNIVADTYFFIWTSACTPILTPGDYSDAGFQPRTGGSGEAFTGSGTRIRKDDGVVAQYVNLGVCGCTVSGPVSGHVGVGADGSCYCSAGYDWDATAHACLPPKYHLNVDPLTAMQCGPTKNCTGDPINPITGAVFDAITDASNIFETLPFKRSYNSVDSGVGDLSGGWRHSYSRSVMTKYTIIEQQRYIQSASTSSQYDTPVDACQRGFPEIQSRAPAWATSYAIYAGGNGGNCQLFKNGVPAGSITVYSSATFAPASAPNPVAYDVIRDDGQLIRFIVDGAGAIVTPPGMNLKLQKTTSGFTVTDSNDNIEQYDANGKLLTVTSRTGLVQTMSYDGAGRLSAVSDSFGHQLNFGYDGQDHLSTVTRQ